MMLACLLSTIVKWKHVNFQAGFWVSHGHHDGRVFEFLESDKFMMEKKWMVAVNQSVYSTNSK
jgi:hypothetical protein